MSLNVTYGVSTWLWTSPFQTAIADKLFSKIAKLGFDVVEIAVEDPALIDTKEIKKILQAHGLKAGICGAFGPSRDLTNESKKIQQEGLDYIRACFDLCNQLEVDFLGGPMYAAVGKARMIPADQRKMEWELAVKNLQKVAEMAAARDLRMAIEPLNRFESDLVNTVDDVVRLVTDINDPAACIMIDSFHMSIEERDVEKAIVTAGDRLIHVQVSENYRGTPGSGQTPWHSYRKGLERINYNRTITIESFTTENTTLAGAVCFWHPKAESQDAFASEGLDFLRTWATENKTASQHENISTIL